MTEIPRMPPEVERAVVIAQIQSWRAVIDDLNLHALELVRRRLRSPHIRQVSSSGNVAELRAELLDLCVRRIVELRPTMADYYAPEMLPVPPADLADGIS